MTEKEIIKRNFSRFAASYDDYCGVQNSVGAKLIAGGDSQNFTKILDVGCGTGNYTSLLRNKFPDARIKALDISKKMIEVARKKLPAEKIDFVVADAGRYVGGREFDLVTSNACFQWFDDLGKAVGNLTAALESGGVILFSIFGPLTFCELCKSLSSIYGKKAAISSSAFAGKDKIERILGKYFDSFSIKEEILKQSYDSLPEMLNTIKYTGTRGAGINGQRLSRAKITELEEIYKELFGRVVATYQIFYCRAKGRILQ